jgi:hypothetical protein
MKVIFQVLLDDSWEKTNQIDSNVSKADINCWCHDEESLKCAICTLCICMHMHIMDAYGPHMPYACWP